eukprot:gene5945-6184_t
MSTCDASSFEHNDIMPAASSAELVPLALSPQLPQITIKVPCTQPAPALTGHDDQSLGGLVPPPPLATSGAALPTPTRASGSLHTSQPSLAADDDTLPLRHPPGSAGPHRCPGSSLPSPPVTLDDLLPLLTSDQRSGSDALLDLYQHYLRQGSGSFSSSLLVRHDSTLSAGGPERSLSGLRCSGSGLVRTGGLGSGTFFFGPEGLMTSSPRNDRTPRHTASVDGCLRAAWPSPRAAPASLRTTAPAGLDAGSDSMAWCSGLMRHESFGSLGSAKSVSPSLAALLSAGDGFKRSSQQIKGSHDQEERKQIKHKGWKALAVVAPGNGSEPWLVHEQIYEGSAAGPMIPLGSFNIISGTATPASSTDLKDDDDDDDFEGSSSLCSDDVRGLMAAAAAIGGPSLLQQLGSMQGDADSGPSLEAAGPATLTQAGASSSSQMIARLLERKSRKGERCDAGLGLRSPAAAVDGGVDSSGDSSYRSGNFSSDEDDNMTDNDEEEGMSLGSVDDLRPPRRTGRAAGGTARKAAAGSSKRQRAAASDSSSPPSHPAATAAAGPRGGKQRAGNAAGGGGKKGGRQRSLNPSPSGSAGGSGGRQRVVYEETRSRYRGVTRHRRSGRWESHIWVKDLGRQVYLGGYEQEEAAAEAYDMAALKCKGPGCLTNFPPERYSDLLSSLHGITLEELIMAVRRQSQGFSRGSSNYRGVTAHPSGRWESRIGIPGSRHVYLGLYGAESAAARAYDTALVRLKGTQAATNYSLSEYQQQLAEHHQMKMAVQAGLVSRDLFKKHSGPEFEMWIKQGLSGFSLQVSEEAWARAQAETDAGMALPALAPPVDARASAQ